MALESRPTSPLFSSPAPATLVEAYTDGSCLGNPGPGGWAAILRYGERERELSGGEAHTTNNRMELAAVLAAVRALKRPCRLALATDSRLVIGLLSGRWRRRDPELAALCDQIEAAARAGGHELALGWVRGHHGHGLNERADRLAREAAARPRTAAGA